MASLADAWWEAANAGPKDDAGPKRARAGHWYGKAAPELTGVAKSLAEKRVAELAKVSEGDALVYRVSLQEKGIDIGMKDRDVGQHFAMEFELRTTMSTPGDWGVVLTKRQHPDDGCLTVVVRDGVIVVISDASWHRVDTDGTARVNDGKWHRITVTKRGAAFSLTVDGKLDAKGEAKATYESKSPWMLGWHGAWGGGAFDGEVRNVKLGGTRK